MAYPESNLRKVYENIHSCTGLVHLTVHAQQIPFVRGMEFADDLVF